MSILSAKASTAIGNSAPMDIMNAMEAGLGVREVGSYWCSPTNLLYALG